MEIKATGANVGSIPTLPLVMSEFQISLNGRRIEGKFWKYELSEEEMEKIDWSKPRYPKKVVFAKEGDTVQGTVDSVGEILLDGRLAKFVALQTEEGLRTLWLGNVLENNLEGVKKGDYVGVKYLGMVPSEKKGHQAYRNYDVRLLPTTIEGVE